VDAWTYAKPKCREQRNEECSDLVTAKPGVIGLWGKGTVELGCKMSSS